MDDLDNLVAPAPAAKPRSRLSFYGPWALVTGASDGIGRAFCVELAKAGANLILVARREAALEALANELSKQYKIAIRFMPVDLSQTNAVAQLLHDIKFLDVGLLVAAAGFGTSGAFAEGNLQTELELVDVNCRAVTHLAHAFAARLSQRKVGGIILMSSLVAFQGVPLSANYAASKAYVQSLAEALHHELKPLGVDVIASAPGPVHSGFAARAGMVMGKAAQPSQVAVETLAKLGRSALVRPGFLAKFLELSLKLLPRWGRVRMMSVVMSGMVKRKSKKA